MKIEWRTDKPPESEEEYLVTLDNGELAIARWTDINPIWTDLTTDWHWVGQPQYTNVIAWMPLLEPYMKE